MSISTFLSFIIFLLLALSFALCFVRYIRCNRERTINRISNNNLTINNDISISDNYLFGETKHDNINIIPNSIEAPPINHIPIVTGEKVDNILNGITVITVEN